MSAATDAENRSFSMSASEIMERSPRRAERATWSTNTRLIMVLMRLPIWSNAPRMVSAARVVAELDPAMASPYVSPSSEARPPAASRSLW